MDWGELLKSGGPGLVVAFIVWVTQRDILRENQSTNRKLARIEARQLGGSIPISNIPRSAVTPVFGVPIRARTNADSDNAPTIPRTRTDEDL